MQKHGKAGMSFRQLDYAGQARSLSGTTRHTERALEANLERAKEEGRDPEKVFQTRMALIWRMQIRIAQRRGFTIRWP